MKKKLQLLSVAVILFLSANVNAETITNAELNLNNPDVRKCLIEASKAEGWKIASVYMNSYEKLVYVFSKDNNDKVFISK